MTFSERDADEFADSWPGSTVKGSGWFSFDNNGDLVDFEGSRSDDGADWVAFMEDCRCWGTTYIRALRRRHEKREVRQ